MPEFEEMTTDIDILTVPGGTPDEPPLTPLIPEGGVEVPAVGRLVELYQGKAGVWYVTDDGFSLDNPTKNR